MFEEVAQALKNKDYQTAQALILALRQNAPENPWLDFYTARLFEEKGQLTQAKNAYDDLLKNCINPKLMSQIRQGIERINQLETIQKQEAISSAKSQVGGEDMGLFILEGIPQSDKKIAAQNFAKIMGMDAYTARLQIPSRSWRLYRMGIMGELSYYVNSLRSFNIPCFCLPLKQISQLSVYQVKYIERLEPQVIVVCENEQGQIGKFTFDWSEVQQRVEASVPIFTRSFQFGIRWEIYHTQEILDYAQVCDLHLLNKKAILRMADQSYDFQKSVNLWEKDELNHNSHGVNKEITIKSHWNQLLKIIKQQIPQSQVYAQFSVFGETALDFAEFLAQIKPHIHLYRQEPTLWDQAFHLYSSLAFWKS
jgi:hypothetical protein